VRSLGEYARNDGEGRRRVGEGNGGGRTDTRGPKWSEMMLTARRMPCCDTMAARRAAARDALGFFCARCGGGSRRLAAPKPSSKGGGGWDGEFM